MLKLISVQLAIFAVLLILSDAILWLVAPVPKNTALEFRQDIPGLKTKIKYSTIGGDLRSLSLKSLRNRNDSIRVLCLGASTTEQATQNVEDTWCALVEQRLKSKHPEWRNAFHTLSHGKGGDRSVDTLRWIQSKFDKIRPDVVITLLGGNDMVLGGGGTRHTLDDFFINFAKEHPDRTTFEDTIYYLTETCKSVSQICKRIAIAWANMSGREGKLEWHSSNLPHLRAIRRSLPAVDQVVHDRDPIILFEAATRRLLEFLRDRGVKVIVLGGPTLWKADLSPEEFDRLWIPFSTQSGFVRPSSSWLIGEMRRYNEAQRKLASHYEMPFIDLDSGIPKTLEFYFDDVHFTDRGSQAVARLVMPTLERIIAARLGSGGKLGFSTRN